MKFIKQFTLSLLLICGLTEIFFAQKMKTEDVLAKHLESIGTADARAAVKTLIAVGDATAKFTSTKDQTVQGRIVLASDGGKNFFGLNMNSTAYPGERFSFDGKNTHVAFLQSGQRSVLGNFVQTNNRILDEGVFGGVLSSSWLMLKMEGSRKLSFDGKKKIEGKETYVLGYTIKGGDVDIILYFDKDNFRHVRTEYKRTSSAGIGVRPEDSTRYSATNLKVTEDFTDFKAENGLTLPHSYRLFYSITGQNGTTEIEWNFNLTEFALNQKLDSKTFDAVP
jgi:hypothetical protein